MNKKILKLFTLFIVMFIGITTVNAADYKISAGSKSLTKGGTTKLTIKGIDVTGRFNIKSSNSSVISISEDRAWIENDTYTITLSAISVGTSTITVTPSGVSDGSGNAANLSSKSITITVSLPREKSTDNYLKSLSIENYELTPSFSKDVLEYSVNVPEGTASVNVLASPSSNYATITGTGSIDVISGINNLNVVVKSESGSERVYKIVVNVIDENPINVTVDEKKYTVVKLRENYTCPTLFEEGEQVIENIPVPACINNNINYTLIGLKNDEGEVSSFIFKDNTYTKYNELVSSNLRIINLNYEGSIKGLKETSLDIDGTKYQAYQYNDSSRFYVIYGKNIETGEEDFYLYDTKNKTFSNYDKDYIDEINELNKTYLYVIIAFGCGLFFSLVCIIILMSKKKHHKNPIENKIKKEDNKKKSKKNEEVKNEMENNNQSEIEDINEVTEINNEDEKTETYYLFESDKKKKHKRK